MPEHVDSFDFKRFKTGDIYDWDTLLNGQIWRLVSGKDFTKETTAMINHIRSVARHRGIAVRAQKCAQDIVMQATGKR